MSAVCTGCQPIRFCVQGLDCGFTIHQPDELRASVHALAQRLTSAAGRRPGPHPPGGAARRPR